LQHVPYKGNAQADLALLANEVQGVFGSMPALLQHTKAGKLRPLAVGSSQRSPALPDVPTVAEAGYPGFEVSLWLGVFAPAGTPRPVIDRLHKELLAIVPSADAISNNPEQFAKLVTDESARYTKVVKTIGLKLD
jgi:tripartite-type tricarboxylate transporter receptor subunit TctC